MLCPHCGSESSDSARACPKCGFKFVLDGGTPVSTDVATQERQLRKVLIVGFVALLGAGAAGWLALTQRRNVPGAVFPAISRGVQVSQPVVTGNLTVKPKGFVSYTFTIPTGSRDGRLDGTFAAANGDKANVLEILVFAEKDYLGWKNHTASSVSYKSGRVTHGTLSVSLPSPGRYYLVVTHPAGTQTGIVQANVVLHYTQ